MKLLSSAMPDNHNFFFFGDTHDDSPLSSDSGWNILCHTMNSEYKGCSNNSCSEGGDMMEAIMIDDKRFSKEMLAQPLPLVQVDRSIKKREPIKHLYKWMLSGNHEMKLWKFGDLAERIANKLDVPYGTYTTKFTVLDRNGNTMYKIYDTHGRKGIGSCADDPIRREANHELILKRHLAGKAGDCAVMIKHHVHKLIVAKPRKALYLTDDGNGIKQNYTSWGQSESYIHPDARWYGCAGSFLKMYGEGYSGYAEIAEYDPVELGFLILVVRDRKIVSLDPYYLNV